MQTVTTSFTEHIGNKTKTRFRTDLEKTDKTERKKTKTVSGTYPKTKEDTTDTPVKKCFPCLTNNKNSSVIEVKH